MDRYLFRGKRLDNGEWVIGFLIVATDTLKGIYENANYSNKTLIKSINNGLDYEIEFKTIGQCTGLKDKNGKLIFEGDIVKHTSMIPGTYDFTGEVQWLEDRYSIVFQEDGEVIDEYLFTDCDEQEVIGNIHDKEVCTND